jgi:hypothetical protein
LSIGYSAGFSSTYTLGKAISGTNTTGSLIRYGLCRIYKVHTFDIYYTNIFGSSSFVTAAVYYEPISMCVKPIG